MPIENEGVLPTDPTDGVDEPKDVGEQAPRPPRRRRETPAMREQREAAELQAYIKRKERQEELEELNHENKKAGLVKTRMLRILAWTSVIGLFSVILVFCGVFLYFAIKQGVLNDAGLITGVLTIVKEVIGILVGL